MDKQKQMLVEGIHVQDNKGGQERRPLGDPRIPNFQNNENQRGPLSSPLYYYCARRFKFSRGKNVGSASLHSTVGQILLENILGMKYKKLE